MATSSTLLPATSQGSVGGGPCQQQQQPPPEAKPSVLPPSLTTPNASPVRDDSCEMECKPELERILPQTTTARTVVVAPPNPPKTARVVLPPRSNPSEVAAVPSAATAGKQQPVITVHPPATPVVLPNKPLARPVVVGPTAVPTAAKVVTTGAPASTLVSAVSTSQRRVVFTGQLQSRLAVVGSSQQAPQLLQQQQAARQATLNRKNLAGIVISGGPSGRFETYEGTPVSQEGIGGGEGRGEAGLERANDAHQPTSYPKALPNSKPACAKKRRSTHPKRPKLKSVLRQHRPSSCGPTTTGSTTSAPTHSNIPTLEILDNDLDLLPDFDPSFFGVEEEVVDAGQLLKDLPDCGLDLHVDSVSSFVAESPAEMAVRKEAGPSAGPSCSTEAAGRSLSSYYSVECFVFCFCLGAILFRCGKGLLI